MLSSTVKSPRHFHRRSGHEGVDRSRNRCRRYQRQQDHHHVHHQSTPVQLSRCRKGTRHGAVGVDDARSAKKPAAVANLYVAVPRKSQNSRCRHWNPRTVGTPSNKSVPKAMAAVTARAGQHCPASSARRRRYSDSRASARSSVFGSPAATGWIQAPTHFQQLPVIRVARQRSRHGC